MSIGSKVRVYELTRELNLETKDILAICEQLNIAVKSHSSTITESEANLIRASAPERKSAPSPSVPKPKEVTKDLVEKDSRPVKQQIVTVSKPTINLAAPPTIARPPQQKNVEVEETQIPKERGTADAQITSPQAPDLVDSVSGHAAATRLVQPPNRQILRM
jgi:translation initiation factor IF-2